MSTDIEMLDVVRTWLHDSDRAPADRVVATVLARLEVEPQLRPVGRSRPDVGRAPRTRTLLATAAVVVVAVVGVASLTLRPLAGPAATSSAAPSSLPSSSSSVRSSQPRNADGDAVIPAGRYSITTPRYTVQLTMPEGWLAPPDGAATSVFRMPPRGYLGMVAISVTPFQITHVVANVCVDEAAVVLEPIGPSSLDLRTALTNQAGIDRAGPTFVSVGRYPAREFELRLRPACPGDSHGLASDASRTYALELSQGSTQLVYVVDVEGTPLVISAVLGPDTSTDDRSEIEAIIGSAEIALVPNPPPLTAVGGGGWLPGGAHRLNVDGLPLTFTVPPAVSNRGWVRYGTFNVTFDAVGSQGAEASVYWTAFPDGDASDPCPQLALPTDGSISELADAVASIPGTSLVSGSRPATVGGHPARYLSLKVEQDRGCDPPFLFKSDEPRGGPGWWTTDVGDTLRIWIVDVAGKRMFIVGETKPEASPSLRRQVDDIVASISFQ